MSENPNEALRDQTFLWVINLAFAGNGVCHGCMQKKAVFAR